MSKYLVKRVSGIIAIILLTLLSQSACFSQNNKPAKKGQQEVQQPLTAKQTAEIKSILSQYKAATLTAEEAKAIHEKFRAAGIRAGSETKSAIIAAGFDPEKLRSLAPPPQMKEGEAAPKHQTNEERIKILQEKVIAPLSLTTAQKESINKIYLTFFEDMDKLVKDREKKRVIEKERDSKIQQILTKEQFAKYIELEKSNRPPRPEGNEPPQNPSNNRK